MCRPRPRWSKQGPRWRRRQAVPNNLPLRWPSSIRATGPTSSKMSMCWMSTMKGNIFNSFGCRWTTVTRTFAFCRGSEYRYRENVKFSLDSAWNLCIWNQSKSVSNVFSCIFNENEMLLNVQSVDIDALTELCLLIFFWFGLIWFSLKLKSNMANSFLSFCLLSRFGRSVELSSVWTRLKLFPLTCFT